MLRSLAHRLFVVPALLLAVFIALSVLVEYRLISHPSVVLEDNEFVLSLRLLNGLMLVCGSVLFAVLLHNARSHRRSAKQALEAEARNVLFAAALQSTDVGVLIRDERHAERSVAFINQAFTDLTGYNLSEMNQRAQNFLFGWHTDATTVASLQQSLTQQQPAFFNLLAYRKDGSSFWSEWHISPVFDRHGSLTHHVILLTDVSDLRQTQQDFQLAKEQAERASVVKTQFLAMMSHEIRTPINGLLGILSLLSDTALNAEQKRLLDIAVTSSQALHKIINDILDYSKIEAGKFEIAAEPFDLYSLLHDITNLTQPLATNKGLTLQLELEDEVPNRLVSDAGRLRQVLLNLVTNAIKFTDHGGVTLRVLHLMNQGAYNTPVALVRFEVIDTGIGISAADQDKLFQEFSQIESSTTRRFGGTGLGLAISRRLVQLLGGEIGVESKPHHGSKFWFVLPLPVARKADNALAAPLPSLPTPAQTRTAHILLVEDNPTNQMVASRYLEKAGYRADTANNGVEAVQKAQERSYDLILMDVSMPEMDGLEATRRIRAMGSWAAIVPILALTAHAMSGDRERCIEAGMNDYLTKPLAFDALKQALERWLASEASSLRPAAPLSPAPGMIPELDKEKLRLLAEDLGGTTLRRITEVYLNDSEQRVNALKENGDKGELSQILHTAHTLRSSSANCGLTRFALLMGDLETAAAHGDRQTIATLLPQAFANYEQGREALVREREKYKD